MKRKCAPLSVFVWTDGSHIKGTSKMGYGIFGRIGEAEFSVSARSSPQELARWFNIPTRGGFPSNPTFEVAAALRAIELLLPHGHRFAEVTLASDYIGVLNYATGEWKPKNPKTSMVPVFQAAAAALVAALNKLRLLCPVNVIWVPAHSGILENEAADRLAKAGSGENTFEEALRINNM